MIYIRKDTKQRCSPNAPYRDVAGARYARMPTELYESFDEPAFVGDDETFYNRIETADAPYVTWERRSDAEIAQLQLDRAGQAAVDYLNATDYLFTQDRYAKLIADEPDRAAELVTKRETARDTVRLWKASQVQP